MTEEQERTEQDVTTEQTSVGEDNKIEELKKALDEKQAEANANLAGWQRAQADFANYRKRSEQEKIEYCKYANRTLLGCLLPSIDDLERALESVPEELKDNTWVKGILLIENKLRSELEKQGVCAIQALGEDFDPQYHEAIMCREGEDGKVVEEMQKGYTFHEQVLRPSMVVVGKKQEDNNNEETKEE